MFIIATRSPALCNDQPWATLTADAGTMVHPRGRERVWPSRCVASSGVAGRGEAFADERGSHGQSGEMAKGREHRRAVRNRTTAAYAANRGASIHASAGQQESRRGNFCVLHPRILQISRADIASSGPGAL